MINTLIEKIKGKGTRIVFTEGSDPRILEAAIRLHKENIVVPVLLGNRAEIAGSAAANGWDIEGIGSNRIQEHGYDGYKGDRAA